MAGQSVSFDDQDDPNASFIKNHEHGGEKSDEIAVMIESLKPLPASSPKLPCIYKVSDHIREPNELEAYTPQVISIGPFHRNNPKLQTMESFKQRYLESFEEAADPEMNLEDLKSTIKSVEETVRKCYSETITLGSDDFANMILLDASFIIMYFLKNKFKIYRTENDREILNPWLCNRMQMDFILLENQLPFFIIEKIYDIAFPSLSKDYPSFIELSFSQFDDHNSQGFDHNDSRSGKILHFTDLLRNFCLPPRERRPKGNSEIIRDMRSLRSVTQLARVGLTFKMRKPSEFNLSPLELKYDKKGALEIPCFQLDKNTEIYARNLIAFEQFHYPQHAYITEYYYLLHLLIKGRKDVSFLAQKEIVKWLDDIDAVSVLNRIFENNDCSSMNDNYNHLAKQTNKFYKARRTRLHIMLAFLKRDYFRNPWRGAATIGGILLLLLTVIQTVCALISVKNWK